MKGELEKSGWVLVPDDGFVGHVGGFWRRDDGDGFEMAFTAEQFHANRNGVVHGGMLMTFIDRTMGTMARHVSGAPRGATVSLTHQFLAPARIGDLVILRPEVIKTTGRMVFLSGVACVDDVPVVSAQGVWRMFFDRD